MEERRELSALDETQKTAVTLGKFDGIHRGHKVLIRRILEQKKHGLTAVVFALGVSKHMLYTAEERREKLARMGVDCLIDCPLDARLRRMTPEAFVKEILVDHLHAAYIAVGEDFRFGCERKGTAKLLAQMGERFGFAVEILPKEKDGHREISSTYVREQLNEGNLPKVNELLGDVFYTTGEVLHGRGLGHKHLVPTTNLVPPKEKLLPPNGVYVTVSAFGNRLFRGITNVGYKPTVGGEEFIGVETYLFGCRENLYGQRSKVYFLKFLRAEQNFDSLDELKEQLGRDVRKAKRYFAEKSV